jgi:putative transposase
MPNHIHGIIFINNDIVETQYLASQKNGSKSESTPKQTIVTKHDFKNETQGIASLRKQNSNKFAPQSNNLASIIRGFKIGVKKYSTMNNIDFIWQPRFHDHIIRNESDLKRIREYVKNNPLSNS